MTLEPGAEGPPVVSVPVSVESLSAEVTALLPLWVSTVLPATLVVFGCPHLPAPVPVLLPENLNQFIGGMGWG